MGIDDCNGKVAIANAFSHFLRFANTAAKAASDIPGERNEAARDYRHQAHQQHPDRPQGSLDCRDLVAEFLALSRPLLAQPFLNTREGGGRLRCQHLERFITMALLNQPKIGIRHRPCIGLHFEPDIPKGFPSFLGGNVAQERIIVATNLLARRIDALRGGQYVAR